MSESESLPWMPTVELTDNMLFTVETGETITYGDLKKRHADHLAALQHTPEPVAWPSREEVKKLMRAHLRLDRSSSIQLGNGQSVSAPGLNWLHGTDEAADAILALFQPLAALSLGKEADANARIQTNDGS